MSCELASSTTTEVEPCPGCGATHGVQPEPAPPAVQAWTCTACGMNWAVTVINPSPPSFFDRLAATVEQLGTARSTLRQVIALADDSATLSTEELRNRLIALAKGFPLIFELAPNPPVPELNSSAVPVPSNSSGVEFGGMRALKFSHRPVRDPRDGA